MKLPLLYLRQFLILFLVIGYTAVAQDDTTTKFIDSLKTPAPVVVYDSTATQPDSAAVGDDSTVVADEEILPDTAIISNLRKIGSDSLNRIKKDKGFYYQHWLDSLLRDDEAHIKRERPSRSFDLSALNSIFTVFKILLWLLAAAILMFVVYKLFLGKNALFIKNRKNIEAAITLDEQPSAKQYGQLVKSAELENDYRMAVRYRYLQALSDLAEKEFISLGADKTNYQYIAELRKHAAAAAGLFAALTVKYEYSWYGEYQVSEGLYAVLKHDFENFYKETIRP